LAADIRTHFDGSVDQVGSAKLHPSSVGVIYRRLVRAAWKKKLLGEMSEAELGRWLKAVSSHSIRVGVAQDNFVAGESLPAIMQAYRGGAMQKRSCATGQGWRQRAGPALGWPRNLKAEVSSLAVGSNNH